MKSARVLVSAILIPALLVASGKRADDSVQKLLRKPRYGRARISFTDGTQAAGVVNRVTSQFLTLREVDTCRNLELAGIEAVEKGRYEVIGQELRLVHGGAKDGSGLVETVPLQFDCDSLILGGQKLSTPFSTNPAQAPIVARWLRRMDRNSYREFTASGTFEKRIAESQIQGQIQKIKGGVRVKWLGPNAKPDEDWGIRTKAHHLFITAGGATTEYVRAAE